MPESIGLYAIHGKRDRKMERIECCMGSSTVRSSRWPNVNHVRRLHIINFNIERARIRCSKVLEEFEYILLEERIRVTWTESEYNINHRGSQNLQPQEAERIVKTASNYQH